MLISHNGDMEKADNNNAKMNSVDLNNADAEKASSLNAQKIKSINNFMQQNCAEKNETFCNDELKKHISILCEYQSTIKIDRIRKVIRISSVIAIEDKTFEKHHKLSVKRANKTPINVDLSKIGRHANQRQTRVAMGFFEDFRAN